MTHSRKSKASKKSTVRRTGLQTQVEMPEKEIKQSQLEQITAGGASILLTNPKKQGRRPTCDTDA